MQRINIQGKVRLYINYRYYTFVGVTDLEKLNNVDKEKYNFH